MSRGREVLRGRLGLRRTKTSKLQPAEIIVYSASHDGKASGQIEIFEEAFKIYQKPKKVVMLTELAQPGVQGGSPCTSLSCSPSTHSPKNSFMAASPPMNSHTTLWPFQILTKTGEVYELFAESPEDQRQWLKRLGLLIMFPYSPIPEEPAVNPIREGYKSKLNARDYNADSVWAVYILPEEVGSRVHVLGLHILTLKSRVSETQPGQLSIISAADHTPIVTWDRDKMRRTGCLGNMVFIEIGRRCRGGPGLVWMYVGPKETAALRETLHMFLFKGDGRAVPITAQPPPPEPGRASFDSGFPPSYHKRGSQSSLQRSPSINTPQRQLSIESQPSSDSGHPSSPFSSNSNPPPIDFDSHPNRIKSRRSAPRTISAHYPYENTSEMDSSRRSSSSYRDSINSESFTDEQFPLEPEVSPNDSFPDERSFVEHDGGSHHPHFNTRHYSVPSMPSRQLHRSHSTATCHPSQRSGDYERMIHPRHSQGEIKYGGGAYEDPRDQYVKMQPASINGPESALAQLRISGEVHTPSPPYQQSSQSLQPINEDRSDYENFPLTRDIESESFTYYTPSYENITQVRQELASRHSPSSGTGRTHREPVVFGPRLKSVSPQSHNVRMAYIGNRDSPSPEIIATP
ncbi:PREDICTED: insulin receptor substrate 1-like isoform X2 [Amphimedon queenslandica]|nr:PREDICTED: insulin receptor substrate 1-like isoform X2 [Amphimedon queenslandica]|eukprot:XP_019856449.1 PREDICTED: insulin receptor substrate 1-like isoform X2 [Amphimedon queenslandica]